MKKGGDGMRTVDLLLANPKKTGWVSFDDEKFRSGLIKCVQNMAGQI